MGGTAMEVPPRRCILLPDDRRETGESRQMSSTTMKTLIGARAGVLMCCGLTALGYAFGAQANQRQVRANDTCLVESVGIDTSHGNASNITFFGNALAQVFWTEDTLVSSVTFWRPTQATSGGTPVRLYILGTQSLPDLGLAPYPLQIIHEGPELIIYEPSPQPVPVRSTFDPPIALPGRGFYAVAIRDDLNCSGIFRVLLDSLDTYSQGGAWRISNAVYCGLGLGVTRLEGMDLIFQVEFCRPEGVSARDLTWGRVRATYR